MHLLNEFITYTISLKIILITNKTEISELMDREDSQVIQEMDLPPLSTQDAVRMMHLMCKHLSHFRADYPTDRDLYKHKMFKEFFEFTPAQVMKMCNLIQRKVTLDEIYEDLVNERKAEGVASQPSMKKTESEMDNRLFSKIEKEHEDVIKIIYILCHSSAGLFYDDMKNIIVLNRHVGTAHRVSESHWDKFLQCRVVEKNEPVFEAPYTYIYTKPANKNKRIEFEFIDEVYNEKLKAKKLYLNASVAKMFRAKASSQGACVDFARQYLCYMGLLSRQLLRHIKKQKLHEFDPYVLSTQIDEGMWSAERDADRLLGLLEQEQSPEHAENLRRQPEYVFLEHEANFLELIDHCHEIFGSQIDDAAIAYYYGEICLNILSIYFMLQRSRDI